MHIRIGVRLHFSSSKKKKISSLTPYIYTLHFLRQVFTVCLLFTHIRCSVCPKLLSLHHWTKIAFVNRLHLPNPLAGTSWPCCSGVSERFPFPPWNTFFWLLRCVFLIFHLLQAFSVFFAVSSWSAQQLSFVVPWGSVLFLPLGDSFYSRDSVGLLNAKDFQICVSGPDSYIHPPIDITSWMANRHAFSWPKRGFSSPFLLSMLFLSSSLAQ